MSEWNENLRRPMPPDELFDIDSFVELGGAPGQFTPDDELTQWVRDTFIEGTGPLVSEQHAHLKDANIGFLWTNVMQNRKQKEVLATAEIFSPQGNTWTKGRQEMQIRHWFGAIPDFIVTFYAPWATVATDEVWCAVVEHELCHCAQRLDGLGFPAFHRDSGAPLFAIRGHDVEEFEHVVARYGCVHDHVASFVRAALRPPSVAAVDIGQVCGTCMRRAA